MTLPPPPMIWQARGLCRLYENAGLFDEPATRHPTRNDRHRIEDAVAVCHSPCPVRRECLAFGKESNGSGVHGGMMLRSGKVIPLTLLFARARRLEKAA